MYIFKWRNIIFVIFIILWPYSLICQLELDSHDFKNPLFLLLSLNKLANIIATHYLLKLQTAAVHFYRAARVDINTFLNKNFTVYNF